MDKARIIDLLNKDRADELSAIMQYMGHHYEGEGMESPQVTEIAKKTAIDEMRHAESLAERINYLGGIPIQQPSAFTRGGYLKKMIQDDLAKENGAIAQYKEHIKICEQEGDPTTRTMLEGILAQEEDHANTWETILAIKK